MKVDMSITGATGIINMLHSLPAEIVSKRGGPVKQAMAKGARMLRDEAKQNLRMAIAERGEDSTGTTVASVISSRGKPPAGGNGERYLVRVRKKTFINARGNPTSTMMTANLLEYGSAHQPATPWLRPAVQSKGGEVINTIVDDLKSRLDKVVKQLAKQGAR